LGRNSSQPAAALRAALAGRALHVDAAVHVLDDAAGDGEPEARALGARTDVAGLLERLEDAGDVGRRDARARVLDLEEDVALLRRAPQDHPPLAGELEGLAEQIEQHLHEPLLVGPDPRRHAVRLLVLELDALLGGAHAAPSLGPASKIRNLGRIDPALLRGVAPGSFRRTQRWAATSVVAFPEETAHVPGWIFR